MPAFMTALRRREGIAPRALEFVILVAARTGEGLGACWHEFDLEAGGVVASLSSQACGDGPAAPTDSLRGTPMSEGGCRKTNREAGGGTGTPPENH